MILKICVLVLFSVAVIKSEDQDLDSLLDGIFTSPSTPVDGNTGVISGVLDGGLNVNTGLGQDGNGIGGQDGEPAKLCPGGECVPYYLCANNSIISDGIGLIDVRFTPDDTTPCLDYFETCCSSSDITTTAITPPPDTNGDLGGNNGNNGGNTGGNTGGNIQELCGVRNDDGVGFRTVGNTESEFGEFPWMVAILREEKVIDQTLNVYQCGGSLIHPKVVLTGAHCVDNKKTGDLKIRAGEWDTQTKNEIYAHQDRSVVQKIIHPQFNKGNLHNDVALLILDSQFTTDPTFAPHIGTVCLPPQDHKFDNKQCVATGWGKDVFGKEGKYQVILKKVDLPVVSSPNCQASFRRTRLGRQFVLDKSFICAGGVAGKDTCKGDGGSPLACPIDGAPRRYYQSGIVAWGIGCGENQVPGAYVNVAHFRNWIDQQLTKNNIDIKAYQYSN